MTHRHDDELLAGILARTSGSPCRRATELLASSGGAPDAAEDRVPSVDRELLALHLERCTDCRELAPVLAALSLDLPGLAEVRPEPELVGDVLAATLPATLRWRRSWERRWERWVRRPRFAWEAALVLTAVLSVGLSAAGAPGPAVQERVVQLARTNPVDALAGPAAGLRNRLEPAAHSLGEVVTEGAVGTTRELGEEADAWLEAIREALGEGEAGARAFLRSLAGTRSGAATGGGRKDAGTFPEDGASDLERGADAPSSATDGPNAPGPATGSGP